MLWVVTGDKAVGAEIKEGESNPELCIDKAYQPIPTSFPSHFNLMWHLLGSCVYSRQAFLEGRDVLVPVCLLFPEMQ